MRPSAYRRNPRGLRDRQAFEPIRLQAGALFAAGRSQAEVARQLGVARQNVSRWHAQCERVEPTHRQAAVPPGLTRAHGFATDHWTLARITTMIQRLTGTRYHPGHTWKLLRRRGGRRQRPARRAVERDTQAIARWVAEDWPSDRPHRPPTSRGDGVLGRVGRLAAAGDASDLGAGRAHPVIGHHCRWQRCSTAAAICDGSRGGGAALAFHHQVGASDTDTLIQALDQPRRALGGQQATLVWDGLPAHRRLAMAAWLRRQRSWLVVEPLPGDAPELHPVEALWSNLNGMELANLAGDTLK